MSRGSRPRAGRRWRRRRADGDGRDRHAFRHLDDRQQRIESVERGALHRHADDRQHRVRRDHPGRWAAPPAPAMITSSPRPAAVDAYSAISAGVRCADTTWHSCATPNSRQDLVGLAHRVPVRFAAHDDAHERRRSGMRVFQHRKCQRRTHSDHPSRHESCDTERSRE